MIYSLPPREFFGKDRVAGWENFLTDEDINLLLAQPEWLDYRDGSIGRGDQGVVDKNVRSTKIGWLGPKPEIRHIWDKVADVAAEVNRQFFNFDLTGFHELMQLSIYTEESKDHYSWHVDDSFQTNTVPRKLSMSLLLSDPKEFEGGELQVKVDNDEIRTLEPMRGRAYFFPSYTLHRVTPVTKGVRRSIVLWIGGPAFR